MKSITVLKILNPIMAFVFLTAALSVILYNYRLIDAFWQSNTLYKLHIITGQLFIVLAIIHLILNWNWIKSQVLGIRPKKK